MSYSPYNNSLFLRSASRYNTRNLRSLYDREHYHRENVQSREYNHPYAPYDGVSRNQRNSYSPYNSSSSKKRNSSIKPGSSCEYTLIYVPASIKVVKSYHIDDPFLKKIFNPNDINFNIIDGRYTYYQDQLRSAAQNLYQNVPLYIIAQRFRRWRELGKEL